MTTIKERIEKYLDQLENPNLRQHEVDALKDKIKFLQSLDED